MTIDYHMKQRVQAPAPPDGFARQCFDLCGLIRLNCAVTRVYIKIEAGVKTLQPKTLWEKYVADSSPMVGFKINHWRELHLGMDPLRDHALLKELRQVYREIPDAGTKTEYLHDFASAMNITEKHAAVLLDATDRGNGGGAMPGAKSMRGDE